MQLLPQSDADKEADPDLWDRLTALTDTLKTDELTDLDANEILYRLYHEEDVVLPSLTPLQFACTCSSQKVKVLSYSLAMTKPNKLQRHKAVY